MSVRTLARHKRNRTAISCIQMQKRNDIKWDIKTKHKTQRQQEHWIAEQQLRKPQNFWQNYSMAFLHFSVNNCNKCTFLQNGWRRFIVTHWMSSSYRKRIDWRKLMQTVSPNEFTFFFEEINKFSFEFGWNKWLNNLSHHPMMWIWLEWIAKYSLRAINLQTVCKPNEFWKIAFLPLVSRAIE